MFLSTKSSEKVISWEDEELGIVLFIEDEYIHVLLPSGIGYCCVEEVQSIY